MKKSPLKTFTILFILIFFLLVVSVVGFSFTRIKVMSPIIEKNLAIPVNFYIMKISKDTFFKYFDVGGKKKFKRLIIQFNAIENSATSDVEYVMKGYVFKKGGVFADSRPIIESYPTRNVVEIKTPFTLANVEFRFAPAKTFIESLKEQDKFAYLKLEPFFNPVDPDRNIAIRATAMDASDKPLSTAFNFAPATIIFNPCPPDKPEG